MAGLGMLMILTALLGLLLRRGGRLYENRWFQRLMVAMGPSGFIALIAGWVTTEAGRQPWVVYGYFRTAQAVSPITPQEAGVSLLIFVTAYSLVFGTGIYYILKLIRLGPPSPDSRSHTPRPGLDEELSGRRPLAAAD